MKKALKISILIVVVCFCFLVVLFTWIMHEYFFAEIGAIRELERIQSPDGLVDGVIIKWGGGALSKDWYAVYVVPAKHKVKRDKSPQVFLGGYGNAFRIQWLENRTLAIIDAFDTVYFEPSIEPLKNNHSYKVTVTLGLPENIEEK